LRPLFYQKNHNQQPVGQTGIIFFKTYWAFNMSVSEEQRAFNKYPVKEAFKPDIWHRASKDQKRIETNALVDAFLRQGGQITVAPAKKRKGGRTEIFGKDTRAPKVHEHWNRKFYAGDDFVQKGPRFLSKPISERAADKRDIERKGGVAHAAFTGAVTDINGKLQARKESHATTEYHIDLVSDAALRASAKRDGGRHSQKIVTLIEDSADDVTDANRRATIRDDDNLNGVDHAHNRRFKLAA
jgi:hypothetical protein